ncbi:MAG: hypothetical protein V1924_06040 [Candidatus Bathyarchaeota archaeon]
MSLTEQGGYFTITQYFKLYKTPSNQFSTLKQYLAFIYPDKADEIKQIKNINSIQLLEKIGEQYINECKDFIGVDLNEKTRHYLEINSKFNDWKVKIYDEPFKPEHMANECDFIKIDVEGAESCLIDYEFNIPTVMEVHNEDLMKLFLNKGFQTTRMVNKSRNVVIMNNFNQQGLVDDV